MQLFDDSLHPENMDSWSSPSPLRSLSGAVDIHGRAYRRPLEEQVQKAVVLRSGGRPPCCTCTCASSDGTGSKRLSKFNELIAGCASGAGHDHPGRRLHLLPPRERGEAADSGSPTTPATWLARADPKPDQVTVAINTTQMNIIMELFYPEYLKAPRSRQPSLPGRPQRDDAAVRPGLGGRALPEVPSGQRHPAALPADRDVHGLETAGALGNICGGAPLELSPDRRSGGGFGRPRLRSTS